MSGTEVDWVGITSIMGTLGGLVVGAVTTYMMQKNQQEHTDKTRFNDQEFKGSGI